MENLLEKIKETKSFIRTKTELEPEYGIILGTGLGNLIGEIDIQTEIPYDEIPHFPVSTVESHHGKLIFGMLNGKKIMAMQGRFHYYEGYSMKEVTFPVRVMHALGIKAIFISNAAGSLSENIKAGDLMIIRDHINILPEHPLRGKNNELLGPRFPDMLNAYDPELIESAMELARKENIICHRGVYVSIQGPCLETPAEYNFLHVIGGDAVGMSTVPEVIVARHMGIKVFAVSVITDVGYPLEIIQPVTIEEVLKVAGETEPKLTLLMKKLIGSL